MRPYHLILLTIVTLSSCRSSTGKKEASVNKEIAELKDSISLLKLSLETGVEIYTKFDQLNSSLEEFAKDSQEKSDSLLNAIQSKIKERGNKASEKHALEEAENLHKMSTDLIKYIESLKTEMIAKLNSTDTTSTIFLSDSSTLQEKELQDRLDTYIDNINKIYYKVDSAVGTKNPEQKHYKSIDNVRTDLPEIDTL